MILAAHDFITGPGDSACRVCGRKLVMVLTVTADDVGRHGISCYGILSEGEYQAIETERERLWHAVQDAASAGR